MLCVVLSVSATMLADIVTALMKFSVDYLRIMRKLSLPNRVKPFKIWTDFRFPSNLHTGLYFSS